MKEVAGERSTGERGDTSGRPRESGRGRGKFGGKQRREGRAADAAVHVDVQTGGSGRNETRREFGGRPDKSGAMECRNCGKKGHGWRKCNSPQVCWDCKQPGHRAGDDKCRGRVKSTVHVVHDVGHDEELPFVPSRSNVHMTVNKVTTAETRVLGANAGGSKVSGTAGVAEDGLQVPRNVETQANMKLSLPNMKLSVPNMKLSSTGVKPYSASTSSDSLRSAQTYEEVPMLVGEHGFWFINAKVNGMAVEVLLDTAAKMSLLSMSAYEKLQPQPAMRPSNVTARFMNNSTLKPAGMVSVKLAMGGLMMPVDFHVFNCGSSYPWILGQDVLGRCDVVSSQRLLRVARQENRARATVNVLVPARSERIITLNMNVGDGEAIVRSNIGKFLQDGVVIPNCVVAVKGGRAPVVVRNVSDLDVMLVADETMGTVEIIQPDNNVGGSYVGVVEVPVDSERLPGPAETQERAWFKKYDDSAVRAQPMHEESAKTHSKLGCKIGLSMSAEEERKLNALLASFDDVFATAEKPYGCTDKIKVSIDTGDAKPIRQQPFRSAAVEQTEMRVQVNEMEQHKLCRPAKRAEWTSPVVMVRKKNGKMRFCVDYRKLNAVTRKDVFPLPRMEDVLDRLAGKMWFSSADFKSGYWQIPLDEESREKTCFITPFGTYEYLVMPFGLCNAPAIFQRFMQLMFSCEDETEFVVFIDDCVVASATFADHLVHLKRFLVKVRETGMKLNGEKCSFAQPAIHFLGHIIGRDGVQPDPEKVESVRAFPTPRKVDDVRSFLGLASFYRRFIDGFACIAEPLRVLLKKGTVMVWRNEQEKAFVMLKQEMTTAPVLAHYRPGAVTELRTDASNAGLGAILLQERDGKFHVVAFASRSLNPAEVNYTTSEKECLAVVWGTQKFRPYLLGQQFKVVTDHNGLTYLMTAQSPNTRLARWALKLAEFNFTIEYKKGRLHGDADSLSRNPTGKAPVAEDDFDSLAPVNLTQDWDLKKAQEADAFCQSIKARLVNNTHQAARLFTLEDDGILRGQTFFKGAKAVPVLPAAVEKQVLAECHDSIMAGHFGFAKTYARISERFYVPNIVSKVRKYVASCIVCQARNMPTVAMAGPLQPIKVSGPFEQIGVDLLGPFRESNGMKHIIIATDYSTRYVEMASIADGTADLAAEFMLYRIILVHGAPMRVLSDRGSNFLSQTFKEVLRLVAIRQTTTTALRPQCNGLTERVNKTVAPTLSKYVGTHKERWSYYVPFIQFAYNTAWQATIKMSPYEALFGRIARLPLDTTLPLVAPKHVEARQAIEDCQVMARANIAESQAQAVQRQNAVNQRSYEPGDKVWVHLPVRKKGETDKLQNNWMGPCTILQKVSDVVYEIQTQRKRKPVDYYNVDRVRPYVSRDESVSGRGGETEHTTAELCDDRAAAVQELPSATDEATEDEPKDVAPIKRKRGRPRKVADDQPVATKAGPSVGVRRSGRPRNQANVMYMIALVMLGVFVGHATMMEVDLCDCTRMRSNGIMDLTAKTVCDAQKELRVGGDVAGFARQYILFEDAVTVTQVHAIKCRRWFNIRRVKEFLFGETDTTVRSENVVTSLTDCWAMIAEKTCDGHNMTAVGNLLEFMEAPTGDGSWEQVDEYRLLNCIVQNVVLTKDCPTCSLMSSGGVVASSEEVGFDTVGYHRYVWPTTAVQHNPCKQNLRQLGISSGKLFPLGNGRMMLRDNRWGLDYVLRTPLHDWRRDEHNELCLGDEAVYVLNHPTLRLRVVPMSMNLNHSSGKFHVPALHDQFLMDSILDIDHQLGEVVNHIECQVATTRVAVAQLISPFSGVWAAQLFDLGNCTHLRVYGSKAESGQCEVVRANVTWRSSRCGAQPVVGNRSISSDSYSVLADYKPCLSHDNRTTLAGEPYQLVHGEWVRLKVNRQGARYSFAELLQQRTLVTGDDKEFIRHTIHDYMSMLTELNSNLVRHDLTPQELVVRTTTMPNWTELFAWFDWNRKLKWLALTIATIGFAVISVYALWKCMLPRWCAQRRARANNRLTKSIREHSGQKAKNQAVKMDEAQGDGSVVVRIRRDSL